MQFLRRTILCGGVLVALIAVNFHGCAQTGLRRRPPVQTEDVAAAKTEKAPKPADTAPWQKVAASFYGKDFHGRKTASGEPFDANGLTAAHRSLPFGTKVEVRNPKNEKRVTVRINDRGPFVKGRDLDLSTAAARQLGIIARGVSRVEMRVVGD